MSDHLEFEKLMKSLEVKADPVAREKARAAFFKKAEEVAAPVKDPGLVRQKRKTRRRGLFYFAAGMAAMLILFVGIHAAFTPAFLTGTIAGQEKIIRYRLFPAEAEAAAVNAASVYTGELVLLPTPPAGQNYKEELTLCDGKTVSMDAYMPLLAVMSGHYGLDWTARTFGIPDFSQNSLADGFDYCLVTQGLYPYGNSQQDSVTADGIRYVAQAFSAVDGGAYDLYLGELVLIKTANGSALPKELIPCAGQKLRSGDYPALAAVMGVTTASFTLPDLRESSPVTGASYYVVTGGASPYQAGND